MSAQNTLSFDRNALISEFKDLGMDRLTNLDLLADAFQTVLKHFLHYGDPLITLQMYSTNATKTDVDIFKSMVEGGYICATTVLQKGFIDTIYIAMTLLERPQNNGDSLITVLTGFCDIPFFSIFSESSDITVNFVDGEVETYPDSRYWYGRATYYTGVVRAVDYFFMSLSSGDIPKYHRLPLADVRKHIQEEAVFLWDSIIDVVNDTDVVSQKSLLDEICTKGLGKETIPEEYIRTDLPTPVK